MWALTRLALCQRVSSLCQVLDKLDFSLDIPDRDFKAYIFDCDGTLAHSMPLHLNAWNHGLQAAGATFVLEKDGFMGVAGMALLQTVEHWNEVHALQIDAETVIQQKNIYFSKHMQQIQSIQPVVRFAEDLFRSNIPIAVASGGHREDVNDTLRIIGVDHLFPVVTTADDVIQGKPAPDLFLLAAKRLGVSPEVCCVLEDSELGIEAATACGMGYIRIPVLM